jgi:peptidoglycan/LPS O-acetylase OafA/YrhL
LAGYSVVWLLGYFCTDIALVVRIPNWCVCMLLGTVPAMTNLGLPREQPVWFVAYGFMILPLFLGLVDGPARMRAEILSLISSFAAVAVSGMIVGLLIRSGQPLHRTVPLVLCPLLCVFCSDIMRGLCKDLCVRFPRSIVFLAKSSYAFYLVHTPLIWLGIRYSWPPLRLVVVVVCGASVLCLILEYIVQPAFRRAMQPR